MASLAPIGAPRTSGGQHEPLDLRSDLFDLESVGRSNATLQVNIEQQTMHRGPLLHFIDVANHSRPEAAQFLKEMPLIKFMAWKNVGDDSQIVLKLSLAPMEWALS
jgi:hypothetical protein